MKKTGFWIAIVAVILVCSLLPGLLLRENGEGGMARILLDEFRGGKLGRFTLETPEDLK